VKRKDYEGALRALRWGINRVFQERSAHPVHCPSNAIECEALYALHKNFAWVDVEKQWWGLARISATEAICAKPDGAGAYCLMAQVENAEGNRDAATVNWGKCVGGLAARQQIHGNEAARREDVEEIWIAMAREWELKVKGSGNEAVALRTCNPEPSRCRVPAVEAACPRRRGISRAAGRQRPGGT
jgi:hypothetical protein